MNGQTASLSKHRSGILSAVLAYLELMKPELTGLSVLTALCGYYLGAESFELMEFLFVGLGTLLLGGGAGTLNQHAERSYDALMKRTERRPLPSGRVNPSHVLVFGIAASVTGLLILGIVFGLLTGFLGLLTFVLYVLVYTPMKRKSWTATLVGAIPGALPPVIGWTSAGGRLDSAALILFLILFCWQMPHFFSLAWMYRKDYERAGYKMLTVIDATGSRTGLQSLLYCLALIPASVAISVSGLAGVMYAAGSLILGAVFAFFAYRFLKHTQTAAAVPANINHDARMLFFASLMYLPTLFFLMTVDKV